MASLCTEMFGDLRESGLESLRSQETINERKWYAVYTLPQNERAVSRHLDVRQVESFLPTYERERVWKNRQRVKITQALFPSYLFVKISAFEKLKVLQSPGVLRIVGNTKGPMALPESEIEFLRSDFCRQRVEPYHDFVVGQKVRIHHGLLSGIQGVLVRKKHGLKFVLTLELINQNAAIEVDAEQLEPLLN